MARPRSSGKLRSASRSRKSRNSKAKRKKTASRRKAVKRTRPKAGPRSGSRAVATREARPKARSRPKPKSRPGAKARPKPMAKARGSARAARGTERQGALDFEMEAHGPEASMQRHVAATPAPRRRSGRASPNSADYPGESLTVGMQAPDFALPSTLNRSVTLSEFRGKQVVLYFYPKDDTPGCTMEACAFRDSIPRIDAKGAVVLGISLDDELSHQRFAEKYNLNFPLLSDKDAAVSRKYGTYKEKSLYGRSFWGIERTTFVIDREGTVEHVFRRVKVEGHAEEVMATLAV
jgi:peroxiredoxin Q/BCP